MSTQRSEQGEAGGTPQDNVKLWAARAFRARDVYRRDQSSIARKIYQIDGWTAEVHIGDMPSHIFLAASITEPFLKYQLDSLFGHIKIESGRNPLEARDAYIDSHASAYKPGEQWVREGGLYTTLTISRTVRASTAPNRHQYKYFWYDLATVDSVLASYHDEYRIALEKLTDLLLEHLDAYMLVETFQDCSGLYIEKVGKPPCPIRQVQLSATAEVSQNRDISELGSDIAALCAAIKPPEKDRTGLIRASRFAMVQVREKDTFKRFLWCYAGLELIANKLYGRLKPKLARALHIKIDDEYAHGFAVEQLVWPAPHDSSSDPWRSILFKFSVLAVCLSPATADRDVEKFKEVNIYRNGIHGSLAFPLKPPTDVAIELFDRYYTLTRRYLQQIRSDE